MARATNPSSQSSSPQSRVVKEVATPYTAPLTVRAVYRRGKFEPQEPVSSLRENQMVELVVQVGSADVSVRARQIVQRAKLRAAQQAPGLTTEDAWAAYDRAAAALRRALRRK